MADVRPRAAEEEALVGICERCMDRARERQICWGGFIDSLYIEEYLTHHAAFHGSQVADVPGDRLDGASPDLVEELGAVPDVRQHDHVGVG